MTDQLKNPRSDSFVISDTESNIIDMCAKELAKKIGAYNKSAALRSIIREWHALTHEKTTQEKK